MVQNVALRRAAHPGPYGTSYLPGPEAGGVSPMTPFTVSGLPRPVEKGRAGQNGPCAAPGFHAKIYSTAYLTLQEEA